MPTLKRFYTQLIIIVLGLYCHCSYAEFLQSEIASLEFKPYSHDIADIKEQKDKVRLNITGEVPHWMSGQLIRNIPAKFSQSGTKILHWFDGLSILAAFHIENGTIEYHSAFLQSSAYKETIHSGKIAIIGFAQNSGKLKAELRSSDGQAILSTNPNINVQKVSGHFLALGETPLPLEFEPDNLQTIGPFDYSDQLLKQGSWETAHIKQDPVDNTLYGHYTRYGWRSTYVLYKIIDGSTHRIKLAETKVDYASYMHDFSITENYILLTAYPLVASPLRLRQSKYSFIGAHEWRPERGTHIYIFKKTDGSLLSSLKTDSMFAFHHINAFEDNGKIKLYLNAANNASAVLALSNFPDIQAATAYALDLREIEIDPKQLTVKIHSLSNEEFEFPNINPNWVGKKNQYFYAVWFSRTEPGFGVVKYDLIHNTTKKWFKANLYPGEPLFIPHPNASSEDEGVVIFMASTISCTETHLFILDASTMEEIASAQLPHAIPTGLHGKFFR